LIENKLKALVYITLFLISFNGIAQQFADKQYYLIDSLDLEKLTPQDKKLLTSSLEKYHTAKSDTGKINALSNICENMMHDDWEKYQFFQLKIIESSLKKYPKNSSLLKSLAGAFNNIGFIYNKHGSITLANEYYHKSLKIQEKIGDKGGMAYSYINIGYSHKNLGNIPKALEYYHKALKIHEKIGDKNGIAYSFSNIGAVYEKQKDLANALSYYQQGLEIRKEIGDKKGIATSLVRLGNIEQTNGNIQNALNYFNEALKIRKEIGDKKGEAICYNNLGIIAKLQNDFNKTLEYYNKSLKIHQELRNKRGVITALHNLGSLYGQKGDLKKSKEYCVQSLKLSKELGFPDYIQDAARLLSKVYEEQGRGIKALEMYKLHISMRDSINNESTQKASAQQQAKYEYEKQKAVDDAQHDKLLAIEQEEKAKQQILTAATAGGLGLVVVFLIFVFNRLRVTKKQKLVIENQKLEVEQQKEVVEEAHHELEEKNQEILDSITYAKRIQSAILPPAKVVKEYLQESFILYKPKDIVAGDFYWMEAVGNKVLFAAADCTGHGVPGAMVSVVCNNALNRSVREHSLIDPGEILTKTREIVIDEFERSDEEVKDGMDIALCSLEGNKLQYAGAHNPLWIIRNGEIIEAKANKQPIGQFDNPEPYTTHSFELQKGDSIYIFSDGYVDQFGGEKGKKFKAKAFRGLLLSIQDKSMEEQKIIIDEAFETWRGSLEQIDDVCVIGVRI
jgi:serine phosphatase RsbU (regulator of sigma subunit)/Tfp pilus assembly protein PilF